MILPTALATCKLIQQLPTLLRQQCCVRLHEALLTIGRRRRRQRERKKNNRLDGQKTITLPVHHDFLYISLWNT